jgi:hypothetical protein
MTADLYTALGIYVGTLSAIVGTIYYLWMWGE